MRSLKLWHVLLTGAVVVIAVSLAAKHMFDNESRWQKTRVVGAYSASMIEVSAKQKHETADKLLNKVSNKAEQNSPCDVISATQHFKYNVHCAQLISYTDSQ